MSRWPLDSKTNIGIRSCHGTWVSAQPDGSVECNRDKPLGWEMFEIRLVGSRRVSIRSVSHDRYLSAQPNGEVECNRSWVRGWEMWRPCRYQDKIGFLSCHGKFLSAQPSGELIADRTEILGWEAFELCKVVVAEENSSTPSGWSSIGTYRNLVIIIAIIVVVRAMRDIGIIRDRYSDGQPRDTAETEEERRQRREMENRPEAPDPPGDDYHMPDPDQTGPGGRLGHI